MKKSKSKLFFFLILISQMIYLIPISQAQINTTDYPLLASNLNISLTPDSTRDSHFGVEFSEVAITKFDNLGIYGDLSNPLSIATDENTLLYYADVEATIKFNVLSFFDVDNTDSNRWTYYRHYNRKWLRLMTTNNQYEWLASLDKSYYVRYKEFVYQGTDIKLNGIDFEISYTPLDEKYLQFKGKNISASIPPTDAYFEKVVAGPGFWGELAQYTDSFSNLETDVSLEVNDFTKDSTPPGIAGDGQADLELRLATVNAGVSAGPITEETIQERWVKPLSNGDTNFAFTQGQIGIGNLPIKLNPEITKYNQLITVRKLDHISIVMMDAWWLFQTAGIYHCSPVEQTTYKRVVGVHVNNYYVQQEIDVKFKLFSTLQLDVPITQAILDIPEISRGDFVWDLAITGQTDVSVILHEPTFNLLAFLDEFGDVIGWVIGLAILGVSIYLIIKATPLITKGIQMRQNKGNNRVRKA